MGKLQQIFWQKVFVVQDKLTVQLVNDTHKWLRSNHLQTEVELTT